MTEEPCHACPDGGWKLWLASRLTSPHLGAVPHFVDRGRWLGDFSTSCGTGDHLAGPKGRHECRAHGLARAARVFGFHILSKVGRALAAAVTTFDQMWNRRWPDVRARESSARVRRRGRDVGSGAPRGSGAEAGHGLD